MKSAQEYKKKHVTIGRDKSAFRSAGQLSDDATNRYASCDANRDATTSNRDATCATSSRDSPPSDASTNATRGCSAKRVTVGDFNGIWYLKKEMDYGSSVRFDEYST